MFNPQEYEFLTYHLNDDIVIRYYTHTPIIELLLSKTMATEEALEQVRKFQKFDRPDNKFEVTTDEQWGVKKEMNLHRFLFKEELRDHAIRFLYDAYKCVGLK